MTISVGYRDTTSVSYPYLVSDLSSSGARGNCSHLVMTGPLSREEPSS